MADRAYADTSSYRGREADPEAPSGEARSHAIVRTCTYHRNGFDRHVMHFNPDQHTGVEASFPSAFHNDPQESLGELDKLPAELLSIVLTDRLDLASLFAFRQVNRRARALSWALPGYKVAFTQALDCMCAVLRSGLARYTTLAQVYQLLRGKRCSLCDVNYGDFVHLLAWRRICFTCTATKKFEELSIDSVQIVRRHFGGLPRAFDRVPTFNLKRLPRSFFGFSYDLAAEENGGCGPLVFLQAALDLYRDSMVKKGPAAHTRHRTVNVGRLERALAGMMNGNNHVANRRFPGKTDHIWRRVCVTMPSYDSSRGVVEHGVCCSGCYDVLWTGRWSEPSDVSYSHEGFLQHFENCERAQELWESSDGGKVKPRRLHINCDIRSAYNFRYQVPQYV